MMITGRQIREARVTLGWSLAKLAAQAEIPAEAIERAESTDDTPGIMLEQGQRLRNVFERAGVEFDCAVGIGKGEGRPGRPD